MKSLNRHVIVALSSVLLLGATQVFAQTNPNLHRPAERSARTRMALIEEARHQLLTLPYYGIFDWLDATVGSNGKVILHGQVVRPTTKDDAEARIKKLENVKTVVNEIEVLPLSTFDGEIRMGLYRRISSESSLMKYFVQAVPPIHIVVQNGHVTLRGVVDSAMDSQLAYMAASGVPNTFEVKNELRIQTTAKTT